MGVVGLLLVLIGVGFVTTVWGIPIGLILIGIGAIMMAVAVVRGGLGALFRLFGPRRDEK